MSEAPFASPASAPPPKSGGSRTVIIVITVFGILGLLCCGGCAGCFYFGGRTALSAGLMGSTLPRLQSNPQVIEKFGEPLSPGLPTSSNISMEEGKASTIDFELSGPKGKGKVHAEFKNTVNGPEATVIRVTAPDGATIDVPTATDPADLTFPDFDTEMEGNETE